MNVRTAIGDALWRLPALGERLKVYQLARFYRTIGMLLRGGTPLVAALEVPVVMMSGSPDEQCRLQAAALGCAALVSKPLRPPELLEAISKALIA